MSKTASAIAFVALIALGIVSYVVLEVFGRDSQAFAGHLLTLLGMATVGLGLGAGLHRIEKQTNGTLSARDAEIAALRNENVRVREQLAAATGATPAVEPTPTLPSYGVGEPSP